ncbi:MAG TPA: NAD(P)/FAD-dependent oxidoreductase [Solirubrobacterales bacterium]
MATREFDAIVLGAGPAGEVAAGRLAQGGLEVAVVERELIGGECSFYACMPSKALLRPGELLGEVRRVGGLVGGAIDPGAALARRDEVIHGLDDSSMLPWLEDRGIALYRGAGRLDGVRRVRVGDEELRARRAVIVATGTAATLPPLKGLADAEPWTNREGTTAGEAPASLIVLGGGPVGCELAQAWRTLGAEVDLVELADRVLVNEEPFASEQVADGLRGHGVRVHLGAEPQRVERRDGTATLVLPGEELEAEQILVAAGRRPRTEDLGLETVGLEPGGWIEVDDALRVPGRDWLYAIGDVNRRALLTHAGKYQARIAADVILGKDVRATADLHGPPRVTFTDPEVAAVGLTLDAARERGIDARVVDVDTSGNAGSSFYGRGTEGTSRLVIDEGRGVIVGATFVGFQTAELLHAATVAITAEVPLERLRHAIAPFPTRNEVWLYLLEKYGL